MPYPSTVTVFTNPLASNRLNAPSHSSIETAQNTGLTEIQTFVGTNSSAVGTLIYDIRATASDGGGHVQTANKGGTGQTTYTKGDLLVATSSSVLAKFAVGAEGQTLIASVGAAAGMVWGNLNGSKILTSASVITYIASDLPTVATSLVSATVAGSVLGTSNAVRVTLFLNTYTRQGGSGSVLFRGIYGGANVASLLWREQANPLGSIEGVITFDLIANNNTGLQRGVLNTGGTFLRFIDSATTSVMGLHYNSGTSSVNSSANQIFGITAQMQGGRIITDGFIVEKIV